MIYLLNLKSFHSKVFSKYLWILEQKKKIPQECKHGLGLAPERNKKNPQNKKQTNKKEPPSVPEVIPTKPNTLSRSQILTTYPGENVANALRVSNQMAGNLENEAHHVSIRFLPEVVFAGKIQHSL